MNKKYGNKAIVDFRMRKVEKEYIRSLGYEIIDNKYNSNVYDEISSHVDIHYLKISDTLIISKSTPVIMDKNLEAIDYELGYTEVENNYPLDIPYNVCLIGNKAIHNFKYTDKKVLEILDKYLYNRVNVEQGYTKCSIAVIEDNSCITSDKGIAKTLIDKGIDVLLVDEPNIKLLKRTDRNITQQDKMSFENSEMHGFIGGAMVRIKDNIVVFGDFDRLVSSKRIREFIEKKRLNIVDFKGLDIIDYGGICLIESNVRRDDE